MFKQKIIIDLSLSPHIKKKLWIFKADIDLNKVDFEFIENDAKYIHWWNRVLGKGKWLKDEIYNPKTKQYKSSELPPNKCKWSLSYGR